MVQGVFDNAMSRILAAVPRPELVLVGLSGGMDSVVLLDVAVQWNARREHPFLIKAAHLNHSLRGNASDLDEEFCRSYSAGLGVECAVKKVDVAALAREKRFGLEEAGRQARLQFFHETAGGKAAVALTAHHADDQAETILLHLRRGAHRRGLCGMRETTCLPTCDSGRLWLGRPFLELTKNDLLTHAQGKKLAWREDESNRDATFARNKIRNDIIPALEAILPGFRRRLLAKARRLAREEEELAQLGRNMVQALSSREKGGRFLGLPPPAFENPEILLYALRHILEEEMGSRLPYGAVLSRLAVLAETGKVGEGLSLPGRLQVRKETDGLFFFFPAAAGEERLAEIILPDPPFSIQAHALTVTASWGVVSGRPPGDDMLDPEVEWFNPAAIVWPLRLRPPIAGERFRPLGAPGSRKLQDVMVDLKIPRRKRSEARVLADHAGAIWLWPYRMAHRARLDGSSLKALRVSIRPDSDIS